MRTKSTKFFIGTLCAVLSCANVLFCMQESPSKKRKTEAVNQEIDSDQQLLLAAEEGSLEEIKLLLDVDTHQSLVEAFENSPLEICGLIDSYIMHANPNARTVGYDKTPLLIAAKNGRADIAKVLIEAGANTEAFDLVWKRTPLHQAVLGNHIETVSILLTAGANSNANDWEGKTPLHYAAQYCHPEIVQLLLDNNANCFIKSRATLTTVAATPRELAIYTCTRKHLNGGNFYAYNPIITMLKEYEDQFFS